MACIVTTTVNSPGDMAVGAAAAEVAKASSARNWGWTGLPDSVI